MRYSRTDYDGLGREFAGVLDDIVVGGDGEAEPC
jgi:hypothetical protein